MDLPKEPNPQPQPTGAVPALMQKWIGITILGAILVFSVIGWAISRWSGPSKGLIAPRQETKRDAGKKNAYQLNEDLEKAYEKGKQEGSQSAMKTNPSTQSTPKQQSQQEYVKLLHEAAMTDNMVEGKKGSTNDTRTNERISPLDHSDGNRPVATVAGGNRIVDPSVLGRGTVLSQAAPGIVRANVLPEGTEIACTLVNQLSGDNTGPVKVQVSNDIPFPRTDDIAIPQGSLFLGEAQKVSAQFQQRLAVSFHLLQLGATAGHIRQISLDKFPGLDQQGSAALTDQVNNHYASIFGASLAVGAIGGLSQIGSGSYGGYGGIDTGTQVRNGISQSTAQSSSQILNRFLNRFPTIKIRPGHPVVVALTANLEIPQ